MQAMKNPMCFLFGKHPMPLTIQELFVPPSSLNKNWKCHRAFPNFSCYALTLDPGAFCFQITAHREPFAPESRLHLWVLRVSALRLLSQPLIKTNKDETCHLYITFALSISLIESVSLCMLSSISSFTSNSTLISHFVLFIIYRGSRHKMCILRREKRNTAKRLSSSTKNLTEQ